MEAKPKNRKVAWAVLGVLGAHLAAWIALITRLEQLSSESLLAHRELVFTFAGETLCCAVAALVVTLGLFGWTSLRGLNEGGQHDTGKAQRAIAWTILVASIAATVPLWPNLMDLFFPPPTTGIR